MLTRLHVRTYLACFALSPLSISFAQQAAEPQAIDDDSLEIIMVTAQKRMQTLQEIPMAIEAISGSELAQRGIDNIQDLSFAIPGFTTREDGPGSYQIFMRGVANTDGGGSLVSVYQDEAPLTLTGYDVLPTKIFDINRVEVLKGPQGTLYGQGSVTGTVRYITNDPILGEFEGIVSSEITSVSDGDIGKHVHAIVNLPLGSDFAIRIVGAVNRDGGWQDQPEAGIEDGNGEELDYLRAKALWSVNEDLEIVASAISYRAEYELGLGYEQPDRTVYVAVDPATTLIPKIWDYEQYNLTLTYDFGTATLTSASSYSDMDHEYPFTYFGGPDTFYGGNLSGKDARYNTGTQFTQELRLSSNGFGNLDWSIGTFYRDLERDLEAFYETDYFGTVYEDLYYYTLNTSDSWAVFADMSYLFTEDLRLGVGLRYFEDDQTEANEVQKQEGTFDSIDPRFYLYYKMNDSANLYVNVAKGFRSGGFNGYDAATGAELPDFDPESLWSYEIGFKGNIDKALTYDVAAYYTTYDDMLRRGLVFVSAELGFQSLTSNIGEVEVKGLEGSISWRATPSLTLDLSASLIDSEVVSVASEDATNEAGDPVDYVPDFSLTFGAHYVFDWGENMPGFVRINYSYRDELSYVDRTSFPDENLPQYSDAIGLLNARIGWAKDNIEIEAFANNITNENQYIDPYHGWNNANRTKPRTIGINGTYRF